MAPKPDVTPAAPEDEQPAIGLIGMGWLLYQFGQAYGWKAFVAYYFIPYVVSDNCPGSAALAHGPFHSCATIGMLWRSMVRCTSR